MSLRNFAAGFPAAGLAAALAAGPAVAQQATAPVLRLDQAIARALADAPAMQAFDEARRAADAGVQQADRSLNPTLSLGAENLGGWSSYQWVGRAETTLSFSQTLEMGGDREARTRLARSGVKAVEADAAVGRQDLYFAIENAYVAAQVAAANRVVANERLAVVKEIVQAVERRVQAARDPLMAASRSQTLLADAEIATESARLVYEAARRELASYWSGDANFEVDLQAFTVITKPVQPGVEANPDLARARAAQEQAGAAIGVEQARARPDPTVSAGVRYFSEFDEAALVVGLSIPLIWADNNSGAIQRAEADRAKLRFEGEALRRNIEREVASALAQVEIAFAEVDAINARLLPAAEQALSRARDGYAAGAFSYLDVLEAQRVLVEARLQRNSALGSYHRARAALARLTGAYIGFEPTREISQ